MSHLFRKAFGTLVVAVLLFGLPHLAEAQEKQARRTNFVIVLADDLGYGDLACYGDKVIKTPNLDRFAKEGLRLTSCYAAHPNCSPSRTGLMTGRTPTRVGIHNWIPLQSPMHLPRQEITIATLLRLAGYATCHVGKWHLNGLFNMAGQPQPNDHGFDHWFSTQNNALPNHKNPNNFARNGTSAGTLQGYSSQLVAKEAIRWLENVRDPVKPFFLYVCFHEPHEPIATAKEFAEMYAFPNDPSKTAHHGNISQMDHAFGRLMDALDRLGLREDTIVFFTSDNGPAITNIHPHGSAGSLRAKKGHIYDGGIRVPGILRWPVRIKVKESDEPVCGVDILPTFCAIAGITPPKDRAIDGSNILPVLEGKSVERKTPLYWHFNGALSEPKVAMRQGDWMLLAHLTGPKNQVGADIRADEQRVLKTADLSTLELYNLRDDIGQTKDLAKSEPRKLEEMATVMRRLYREVRDESRTWPTWIWPKDEQQQIVWPEYFKKKAKSK